MNWIVPAMNTENHAAVGLVGAAVGGLVSALGSVITAISSLSAAQHTSETELRSQISSHALELTKLEMELRLKFETPGQAPLVLAPAKVYRTFYNALLELQTRGTWPKEVENQGLLTVMKIPEKNH
jgi:hypothetical protein